MSTALFFARAIGLMIAAGWPCMLAINLATTGDYGAPFWLFALAGVSAAYALAVDLSAELGRKS